jgi:hypothetical protein
MSFILFDSILHDIEHTHVPNETGHAYGRIIFAPIVEKCKISLAPQSYTGISFASKQFFFICAIFQVAFT